MKRLLYIFLAIIILSPFVFAERYPYLYYPLPEYSAAGTFGTLATIFNPAALAANPDLELMYFHSFNEDKFAGDNTVLFSRQGVGFAWQNYRLSRSPSINSYTFAWSSHLSRGVYAGASYTFMKTDDGDPYHNDHFWNAGFLMRLNPKSSFAFLINNIRRMEFAGNKTEMEYKISAAYRPLPDKITLGADWSWAESQAVDEGFFKFYAAFRIREGMGVLGSIDEDGNFGLGINFSFGSNQIGTYHNFSDDADYRSGLIYSGYTYRPQGWILPVKKKILKLDLTGSYPETEQKYYFWQPKKDNFLKLVTTLNRALNDENICGVFVKIKHPRLGWAQIQELRNIFQKFRINGKPVIFDLDNLSGNGSYYLASCGNKIIMRKVDDLFLTGLLAEVSFFKGTLDKLGVKADFVQIGKYKNAPDIYTQDSMSEFHSEALNTLLDDIYDQIISGIANSRNIFEDQLKNIIDQGPFTSEEALQQGLIDKILYPDEREDWFKEQFGDYSHVDYTYYRDHLPYEKMWGEPPQIAVIPIEGTLMSEVVEDYPFWGDLINSAMIASALKYAREKDFIKGVIIRLNTPGGDGLASDLLHREIELLREKKPVVISMGNIAASAGYQLASAGDYIFSEPSTVTGSIGVFYGKLDLSGLYNKIGMNVYHFKRGENADFLSMSTGYSDVQRDKLQDHLYQMYEHFVQLVSSGRGLAYEYVDSVGQGRVWSGIRAKQLGLVDEIGGLHEALEKIKELCRLEGEQVEIVTFPKQRVSLFNIFNGFASVVKNVSNILLGNTAENLYHFTNDYPAYYYMLPYILKIY